MHSRTRFLILATALCASASGCHDSSSGGSGGSAQTASYTAEVARSWMDVLVAAIDTENLNPPEASRRIGYAGVTLYEALVAGMPTYNSLGQQLNGLGTLPAEPAGRIHRPSVANAALADILAQLFLGASAPTLQSFIDLEASLAAQFALDEPDLNTRNRSVTYGQDIAAFLGAWVDADGYAQWNDCAFTPPTGEGLWVPTPPAFVATPLEPCWGNLRPFALLFSTECAPFPFPTFSKAAGSAFAAEALEVYVLNDSVDPSDNLTPEQQDIARFWADGAGTLTPPGHWVSIANQLIDQEGLDLEQATEAYAKVGIAVADAFISCWEIKFAYNLLRPVTYIRDPTGPIADPAWTSFIGTPPFAEFSSGHSTQSGAAAFVLEDLLGNGLAFTDNTNNGSGVAPRSFSSISAAADEAAISRLYGGIHYRSAIERGLEQGRCIGNAILTRIAFRK